MASMQDASFYCIPDTKMPEQERTIYCCVCIASAALGFMGATWQMYQWRPLMGGYKLRRKPSPNPMIVFSLALADCLACAGVIGRATVMLLTHPPEYDSTLQHFVPAHTSQKFIITGLTIEGLGQYFYGVTFMWTVIYAVDIYLQLSNKNVSEVLYHIFCWTVPALTTAGSILAVVLGHYSPVRCATGWHLMLRYIFYNLLIIFALVGDPVLYLLCDLLISKKMRESGLLNTHNRAIMTALKTKFFSVILIFSVCWLPNVVDFIMEMGQTITYSSPDSMAKFYPLWIIEAVLNPLQGLLNCFVYGRHMLFRRIAKKKKVPTATLR